MTGWAALIPEGLLLAAALAALFGGQLPFGDRGTALRAALFAGAAGVFAAFTRTGELFGGALVFDATSTFVRAAVALMTAAWCLWLAGRDIGDERRAELVSLALFSSVGGMLLASAGDLVTLFLTVELSTMPAYVMMGYRRRDARSLEGALKYFFLSLLTSLVTLYGLSFLYGLTGVTAYAGLSAAGTNTLGLLGAVLAFVGMFAKMSAAPFHFWAPDAYAGAPAASVAFVSTVPKVAAMAAIVRLAAALLPGTPALIPMFAGAAALSMLWGNLAALPQTDLRRLMAYSGIAHSGYLLLGLVAHTETGYLASVVYAVAYGVPSMAIMFVAAEEGSSLADLGGLAERRPWAAWSALVLLLSLVGVPPLLGFFGKLYLFGAALDTGAVWIVVLALGLSAVSAGYYFRVVYVMFMAKAPEGREPLAASVPATAGWALCVAVTALLGVFASPLLQAIGGKLP
ncbi:MAG: hypothetical protein C0418_03235 [Coriobacteriaceae bacterium]|nr:hypothetical protein [Coriobacteriaceae bacterium]